MLAGKVVRIRWVKQYPTAHNHLAIGHVVRETDNYLAVLCKTYHFGGNLGGGGSKSCKLKRGAFIGGVLESEKAVRIIPWTQIEVMHELPERTKWDVEAVVDDSGLCYLDNEQKTLISRPVNGL